jgi:hypothetical protein
MLRYTNTISMSDTWQEAFYEDSMKQMRKAFKKAGFVESPIKKKRNQYKILHLPSAQYVEKVRHTSRGNKYTNSPRQV